VREVCDLILHGYLLLVVIIAISGYYLMTNKASYDIQVEPNVELPLFTGNDLTNTSYNKQGVRSYVIVSDKLNHYASSGDTVFEKPILRIYNRRQWCVNQRSCANPTKQYIR